ncbi:MAG: Xaa-Pro aminopeptidase [Aliidiomarina sp.]|uniref:Xaa-Pro aminopeptidase n=1 Tax=Aliidiomarina sp. TaxID=1872439 RepID=UPI0025C2C0D5|nr:Xaa-Pro aminopeptidase [Aliidiomarina sp.]MCH8501903.1 Xaa-Pro aminopeptidase [Aliidiomarina sp.]
MTLAMQNEVKKRRRQLLEQLPADAIAIFPAGAEVVRSRDTHYPFRQDSDFYYLTGITEPEGVLVLIPDAEQQEILFVLPKDPLQEVWHGRRLGADVAKQVSAVDVVYTRDELESRLLAFLNGPKSLYVAFDQHPEFEQQLRGYCRRLAATPKRAKTAPEAWCDVKPMLHQMRLVKSAYEQDQMRKAAQISAQAMIRGMQSTTVGRFEYQVAADIEHEFKRQGAAGPAYGIICGGGENACILHYTANTDVLNDGDLLLIDAGAEYAGYAGDITRTFPVNGRFTAAQRDVYQVVLDAQEAVIAAIKPGTTLPHLTDICLRELTQGLLKLGILQGDLQCLLADKACRRYFIHGLGHWLGLDVHDVGRYELEGEATPLRAGMVFTVEPGLYFAPDDVQVPEAYRGIGVRIEDDILMTADGFENLTAAVPKQIEAIEALMAGESAVTQRRAVS